MFNKLIGTNELSADLSFSSNPNSDLFNKLLELGDSLLGGLYRISLYNGINNPFCFDGEGCFKSAEWLSLDTDQQNKIIESLLTHKDIFKYPEGPHVKELIRENMELIINVLLAEPAAVNNIGLTVAHLKDSLITNLDKFYGDDIVSQQEAIRFIKENLTPQVLKEIGRGKNNIVCTLNLPNLDEPLILAIRNKLPKKNINDGNRKFDTTIPYDYATQFNSHAMIYADMLKQVNSVNKLKFARIPQPYFYYANDHIAMEYIKNSYTLEQLKQKLSTEQYTLLKPEIRQILKNTLEFWQTGNNGTVLFRHHDLHERNVLVVLNAEGELADVYIIDFDFSIYKPRAEDSNYVIRREIAGQYIRNEIKDKDDYLVNDYLKDN